MKKFTFVLALLIVLAFGASHVSACDYGAGQLVYRQFAQVEGDCYGGAPLLGYRAPFVGGYGGLQLGFGAYRAPFVGSSRLGFGYGVGAVRTSFVRQRVIVRQPPRFRIQLRGGY